MENDRQVCPSLKGKMTGQPTVNPDRCNGTPEPPLAKVGKNVHWGEVVTRPKLNGFDVACHGLDRIHDSKLFKLIHAAPDVSA